MALADSTIRAPWLSREGVITRIRLLAPIVVMVLAATAVPIELRAPGQPGFYDKDASWVDIPDFIVNVIGFVPVGLVLSPLGAARAIGLATLMSSFAETSQLVMLYRDPTPVDVIANVIGAALGIVISRRLKMGAPKVGVDKWTGLLAAVLAAALLAYLWSRSFNPINPRGSSQAGTIEGIWKFDESSGRTVRDSSPHELTGRLSAEGLRGPGLIGGAAFFSNRKQYVEFEKSPVFRLTGSMTITAWIKSSSYPEDDAAIVSQFENSSGYQLDTTIDRGPRTVGFKLTNVCGRLMARYGRTRLAANTWYHVAGVYDAQARTLDVYVNGRNDNGDLTGLVTGRLRSSRAGIRIGKRADSKTYPFFGAIDEVHLYSMALRPDEVAHDMKGEIVRHTAQQAAADLPAPLTSDETTCSAQSESYDKGLPAFAVVLGVLVAGSTIGLRPASSRVTVVAASLVTGLLLIPLFYSTAPVFNRVLIPMVTLAGGVSVAVSRD